MLFTYVNYSKVVLRVLRWKFFYAFVTPRTRATRLSYPLPFGDHPTNILWSAQIIKLTHYSNYTNLLLKYLSQMQIFSSKRSSQKKHLTLCSFLNVERPGFTPITIQNLHSYSSVFCNFTLCVTGWKREVSEVNVKKHLANVVYCYYFGNCSPALGLLFRNVKVNSNCKEAFSAFLVTSTRWMSACPTNPLYHRGCYRLICSLM